jgi:hypothetical protein
MKMFLLGACAVSLGLLAQVAPMLSLVGIVGLGFLVITFWGDK